MGKHSHLPKILPIVLFACLLGLLSACTTVQVTPSTAGSYELGVLQVIAEANVDKVYLAAKAGVKEDRLFLTGDDWGGNTAVLKARDEVDTSVTIKLKQIEPGRTSVRIRYGLTGDLHQAQNLYARISKKL